MKKCSLILVLSLVSAITWGGEGFAETKKEMTFYETVLSKATSIWSAIWPPYKDDKADQKAAREEEQRAINTVNEHGPKLKPIWEAVLQAGQERVQALRNMGVSDTQIKIMYNIDPKTGFNGKELLFLAGGSIRGGWGRTWEGGGEGGYPANDTYDANMVTLLLSGKLTSENLQKFTRIFDVNSKRYVTPQDYAQNKEEHETEIQKGNAFLDQFAYSVYPHDQAEEVEKQYGFGVLLGEDVYQPYTHYFNKGQLGLLQPLFEHLWAVKEEAYYASRYAQQRQLEIKRD
jgi:hypothetical protein